VGATRPFHSAAFREAIARGYVQKHQIVPLSGYTPTIGRLVAMLSYARDTTLKAVEGLSRQQLDHLHDEHSNSIGALLAHIAAVERGFQLVTFEEREPTAEENDAWSAALKLGDKGRRDIRDRELEFYVEELRRIRDGTLAGLAARDDGWLEAPLRIAPALNAHWAWFHVAEDEINHRGQIRWMRPRLPSATPTTMPP
jgi:uncharacterized damage-inducible protein DinB